MSKSQSKHHHEVPHLYSVLEAYELKRHCFQNTPSMIINIDEQSSRRNSQQGFKASTSTTNTKPQKPLVNQRFALSGTGRMAFGHVDNVGEIYRYLDSQSRTQHPKAYDDKIEVEEIKFDQLSIHPKHPESVPHNPTPINEQAEKTTNSLPTSSSSNPRKNKKELVNEDLPKNNKKQNTSKTETIVPTSIPANNKPSVASTGKKSNPYLVGKNPPAKNIVGVAQTTGRVNAMARMAALGEQWAEEEDLPGFSLPVSSTISTSGQISKDAAKEANKSLQRNQKLSSAKKR